MFVAKRPPTTEPERMITVRVRKSEYDAIREAAYQARQSMNLFCVEALMAMTNQPKVAAIPEMEWPLK